MSTPILTTKLYIPTSRLNAVHRPRLIEQLNGGLNRKLTLISAPAGFGKTTLVSQWLVVCGRSVAWLALNQEDNNPTRFLAYVITALQTIDTNIGDGVLKMLQAALPPSNEALLTSLLNEIHTMQDDFLLVLDDYHLIGASEIDSALSFLLEHLPPQMHLVITTREDPNLPLARLRARSQMTELRVEDLRFNTNEAHDFLNQVMNLNLSGENIDALETRTEGWVAGLQLAAISMQGHPDTTRFIQSFTGSHHFVLDYLLEEVLQQQSEEIQIFLVYTSILNRMCGELCDAIMPDSTTDGQTMLENIERANLLIVPLDNTRQWYRYHHLFADVLQARLRKEYPDQASNLHLRASKWYEQKSFISDAIQHAFAARDFGRAANLLELAFPRMDENLQSGIWLEQVKLLPDEFLNTMPVLNTAYAWALLNRGNLETARVKLEAVERLLESPSGKMIVVDQEQYHLLPASIAIAYAYHAQAVGDVSATVKYAQQALETLPKENVQWRAAASSLLGIAQYASGDLKAAELSLADFLENMRKAGRVPDVISITFILADIRVALGRFQEAVNTYQQALRLASSQGEPLPLGTSDLYRGMSELYCERGDFETANKYLLISMKLGEVTALTDWQYRLHITQARLKKAQGDWTAALDLLDEADRWRIRSPLPELRPVAALKTRIWLRQGNLTEALAWAREQGLTVFDELSYLREFEYITLARVLIAPYRRNLTHESLHDALKLLERLLKMAEAGKRAGTVIEILILQALTYEALDKIPEALVYLEQALILAEPEGYVRLFTNEGTAMIRLLHHALSDSITADYTQTLLAAFAHDEQMKQGNSAIQSSELKNPQSEMIEALSERELEVLQHIAEGLANSEIAEQLFISKHTVKVHSRNIYSKLAVHSRTQAVAKARTLGILNSN